MSKSRTAIRKKKRTIHIRYLIVGLLSIVLFFSIVIFSQVLIQKKEKTEERFSTSPVVSKPEEVQKLASEIFEKCKGEEYPITCYEEEIPKTMATLTMRDAFEVTRAIQSKDTSYQYCHTLGHELSAVEVRKDMSKWKDIITQCPSGVCSNGCIHGAFQERFRDLEVLQEMPEEEQAQIIEDLKTVCEARGDWTPTGLEQASCYHAMGHLTMYITFADIHRSIEICDIISVKDDGRDFRQVCYDGAFMQIYQPLEDEDFALIEGKQPTRETLLTFCDEFDGDRRGSCISEAWPLFHQELQDPKGVSTLCELEHEAQKSRCYIGLTWVMTAQFRFDTDKMAVYCQGYPEQRRGQCYADIVGRLIETDYGNIYRAVDVCKKVESDGEKSKCYDGLIQFSTFNFPRGSVDARNMCNAMESPWKGLCNEGLDRYEAS